MKPWKVRIDWLCHEVTVELDVMGERVRLLRRLPSIDAAVDWAVGWMRDRGAEPSVIRLPDGVRTHVILHPAPVRRGVDYC